MDDVYSTSIDNDPTCSESITAAMYSTAASFIHAGSDDGDERPGSGRLTVGISSLNRRLRALKFCGDVERRREPLVREINHAS